MERGLASASSAHLEERGKPGECRTLGVGYMADSEAHVLVSEQDQPLLIAVPQLECKSGATSFDIFKAGEEQPAAMRRPAYVLTHDKRSSLWELRCPRCQDCEYRSPAGKSAEVDDMPRTLLRARQEIVSIGPCGAR